MDEAAAAKRTLVKGRQRTRQKSTINSEYQIKGKKMVQQTAQEKQNIY